MTTPPNSTRSQNQSTKAAQQRLWRPFARLFLAVMLAFLLVFVVFFFWLEANPPPHEMGLHFHPGAHIFFGFPVAFLAVAFIIARRAFRRMSTPMAELMAAADTVAQGDLSVRLAEPRPGPFLGLVRSFNRMTDELERAETQRRNLTADVAHELRTPLHIIQGNLEGILDGVYQPTAEHIASTLEETRLLARLVNDLQTLSLAEAGALALHPTDVTLEDLLQDTLAGFSAASETAGVQLRLDNPDALAAQMLRVDVDRIEQVLNNLVANALRHTPAGGSITLRALQPDATVIALQVQDTGQGIAPADLPFVFDRFWQADKARQRSGDHGSGLGLAIARQLVQAHGGSLTATSSVGQGSCFEVLLPLPTPAR